MVRPRLNCLAQDDPELVETVRELYLDPPSTLPYNFQVGYSFIHTKCRPHIADSSCILFQKIRRTVPFIVIFKINKNKTSSLTFTPEHKIFCIQRKIFKILF